GADHDFTVTGVGHERTELVKKRAGFLDRLVHLPIACNDRPSHQAVVADAPISSVLSPQPITAMSARSRNNPCSTSPTIESSWLARRSASGNTRNRQSRIRLPWSVRNG